jgi:hypothetical protein
MLILEGKSLKQNDSVYLARITYFFIFFFIKTTLK